MAESKERKSDTLALRLSPRIKAAYEALAEREDRTLSHLASDVLSRWIAEHHPELIPPLKPAEPVDPSGGICKVPLYDVRAVAGRGNFIGEENIERQLELTRAFVASLGTVPENLVGLRVTGDSMKPELLEGDVVLVNTHLDQPVALEEDVYVFRLGGELYIKRLVPDPSGSARAISTNPAYAPFDIPADLPEGEFQILGRLVVRWREPG